MDFYIICLCLIAFVSLLLGVQVLLKASKKDIKAAFFGKSIVLVLFTLLAIGLQYAGTEEGALLWHKYYMLLMLILPLSFIAFYALVVKLTKKEKIIMALAFAFFLYVLVFWIFLKPADFCDYSRIHRFWIVSGGSAWSNLLLLALYIILIPIIFFSILWRWNRSCRTMKEKHHSRIILFSLLLTYLFSFSTDFIIKRFISLPHMTPLYFLFYLVSVYYALTRYYFMDDEWNNHLDEILDNVNDIVLILDADLKIQKINSSALNPFHQKEASLIGKNIQDLLAYHGLGEKLDQLISGRIQPFSAVLTFQTEGTMIPVNAAFSVVIDKFGDFLGILVIASATMKSDKFQELFRITKREMDVLIASINGLPSHEIAGDLGISKRTVETHLSSLYTKLDVRNKMDMCNLARRYGLVSS